jgi:hypothetical protein
VFLVQIISLKLRHNRKKDVDIQRHFSHEADKLFGSLCYYLSNRPASNILFTLCNASLICILPHGGFILNKTHINIICFIIKVINLVIQSVASFLEITDVPYRLDCQTKTPKILETPEFLCATKLGFHTRKKTTIERIILPTDSLHRFFKSTYEQPKLPH